MVYPVIEVENLGKIYGYGRNELHVLKKISLCINHGEIVAVMGPSGAGKSTLLNMIGCLDSFQNGSVKILGKDVSKQVLRAAVKRIAVQNGITRSG